MKLRTIATGAAIVVTLGFAGAYLSFPVERISARAAPISESEMADTLAALKPPKRARPVVAVLGVNEGSETTDYLIPYGVLKRSGVADVVALGMHEGPVILMPALTIVPDATVAQFDQRYPDGADYVVVPFFHDWHNAAAEAWLKTQAAKGATIVGICAGVLTLADAGLLHGRRATTHWHWTDKLVEIDPTITYVPNRRYVADRGMVTTTGVSASLPVSLALVEAIAGQEKALAVAAGLGLPGWDAAHVSAAFRLTRGDVRTYLTGITGLGAERVGIPLNAGVDEVTLSLVVDAYEQSSGAHVVTLADGPVVSAQGLRILPDGGAGKITFGHMLAPMSGKPGEAFEGAFADISKRYGEASAGFARLALEYPGN